MAPRKTATLLIVGATVVTSFGGCFPDPPPPNGGPVTTATPPLDCVAVLGTFRATLAQTPYAEIPYSGVPRTGTLGSLTDAELGQLCDFDACIRVDGYLRNCWSYNTHDGTAYQLETLPLLAGGVFTCYVNPNPADGRYEVSWLSRDSCVYTYRHQFAKCNTAIWEDCLREAAFALVSSHWTPSCEIEKAQCAD